MPESVFWREDGTPFSPRFDDIYRTATGGLEQARHTFMQGCGLPEGWQGLESYRILETGFGLGLNFLAAWQAWRDDPRRCRMLHFVSIEAYPVTAEDITRSVAAWPELKALAEQLAEQWQGLESGVQRLSFEQSHVLLTLCIGDVQAMLRDLRGNKALSFDAVFLDGFNPQVNAEMWSLDTLKALSRLAHKDEKRGTTLASWTANGEVRRTLTQCGWQVEKVPGLPPKRESIRAVFNPAWEPKGMAPSKALTPGRCIVIGAGIAGAAAAASFARRGWQVTVLDAANEAGSASSSARASDLPVGSFAPHLSPDDNLLSRLTRAGVRHLIRAARDLTQQGLLREGPDWTVSGVLHKDKDDLQATPVLQTQAGWMKPPALIRAWLTHPNITVRYGVKVQGLDELQGLDPGQADLVVIAAAHASATLAQAPLPLTPVRGQVSWGYISQGLELPATPVNGNGHFIANVPINGQHAWFCGATYERGESDPTPGAEQQALNHATNLAKLRTLLPEAAGQLAPQFEQGLARTWSQVRCASRDRRPLVGRLDASAGQGLETNLCILTALGSRGLSFAALCAELLAARLHDEPLPLPHKLAEALDVRRALGKSSPELRSVAR